MNKVQVTVKNVYGNNLVYPANETAKIFAALCGKKTLDSRDLERIRLLGYEIEQVLPETETLKF